MIVSPCVGVDMDVTATWMWSVISPRLSFILTFKELRIPNWFQLVHLRFDIREVHFAYRRLVWAAVYEVSILKSMSNTTIDV